MGSDSARCRFEVLFSKPKYVPGQNDAPTLNLFLLLALILLLVLLLLLFPDTLPVATTSKKSKIKMKSRIRTKSKSKRKIESRTACASLAQFNKRGLLAAGTARRPGEEAEEPTVKPD